MNNGRRHPISTKSQAIQMRKEGLTHREISKRVGISKSTVAAWTQGIALTAFQKSEMHVRINSEKFTPEMRKRYSERAKIQLAPYHIKHSRESLIEKIKNFYIVNGRIPLKREFNMHGEYRRHFPSWNEAIAAAGFEPHQVIFSKKFTAKDNHICDSFAERIIDDWLTKHSISHIRNMPYPETKLTADFAIGKIRIEYFGLQGVVSGYDKTIERKKELCAQENLILLEIYPSDLFSKKFKKCLGRILWTVRKNV